MKRILLTTIMLASFLFLSGCSMFSKKEPETITVVKVKNVYKSVDGFTNIYNPDKPMNPKDFSLLDPTDREIYLRKYTISLLKTIGKYKVQTKKLIEYNEKNKLIYKE